MVKPKKSLGQHFLTNIDIAFKIVESLIGTEKYKILLEIGPGKGILTDFLVEKQNINLHLIEIDKEAYAFLQTKYKKLDINILNADFLRFNLPKYFSQSQIGIIGNFPYNISNQILFSVWENHDMVCELVGMFQKEVAERITSEPKSRKYGILSVLLQAYYHTEYLFSVDKFNFYPQPKVQSGVIRLTKKENQNLGVDFNSFKTVVKQAFSQRRKMLKNVLYPYNDFFEQIGNPTLKKRAEELSWQEFVEITKIVANEKL